MKQVKKINSLIFAFFTIIFFVSCRKDQSTITYGHETEFKQKMRDFVIGISKYSKAINPKFNIIPQNGIELVSSNGKNPVQPNSDYLKAIDAIGQEDLFYGYDNDDQSTSTSTTSYLIDFLNISKNANKKILVTDYCSTSSKVDNSFFQNNTSGYVSFAASKRELTNIPTYPSTIYQQNNAVVISLDQVKNFLYLINLTNYPTKRSFINAVTATNYDLIIMDLFFKDGSAFSASEINELKSKANGGKRLVISYMSIGEAENYRYYWQTSWQTNKPNWLDSENPKWAGNFEVKYWNPEWQSIIYGNENSYLKKILNAGFDGAYLDIIDAFEYYEK